MKEQQNLSDVLIFVQLFLIFMFSMYLIRSSSLYSFYFSKVYDRVNYKMLINI